MKIKTEIIDSCEEEILIRCRARTETVRRIEALLEQVLRSEREMVVYLSGVEHYVPVTAFLFFETAGGKVYAHTATEVYTTAYKLIELEAILPTSFVRISKSAIANVMQVASLRRELVGNGELTFKSSVKSTYFSRAYYPLLRKKIDEMRLQK